MAALLPSLLLRRDLARCGIDLPQSKKKQADLDAVERAEQKRHSDELLRSAGLDPRPPRRDGRAFQSVQEIRERLAKAVREEDYELAAKLRDELRNKEDAAAGAPGP